MNRSFLSRFEISNFKKFGHLIVENLGQVNLITGDNNVGKTTLLEALMFDRDNTQWVSYLHRLLCYRGIHIHPTRLNSSQPEFPAENYLASLLQDISKPLSILHVDESGQQASQSLQYRNIESLTEEDKRLRKDQYDIANVQDWILFFKDGQPEELQWMYMDDLVRDLRYDYWPLISFGAGYGPDLINMSGTDADPDQAPAHKAEKPVTNFGKKLEALNFAGKQKVIEGLRLFIPDVLDYEVRRFGRDHLIGIATASNNSYLALTQYGDGVQKVFRYLVEIIFAARNGMTRMMIDEIDVGVHFSKMKGEWKLLFELARETGIQLFATTHSQDCITAFAEAAEEDLEIRPCARVVELEQSPKAGDNRIYASTYEVDQIAAGLTSEVNLRG